MAVPGGPSNSKCSPASAAKSIKRTCASKRTGQACPQAACEHPPGRSVAMAAAVAPLRAESKRTNSRVTARGKVWSGSLAPCLQLLTVCPSHLSLSLQEPSLQVCNGLQHLLTQAPRRLNERRVLRCSGALFQDANVLLVDFSARDNQRSQPKLDAAYSEEQDQSAAAKVKPCPSCPSQDMAASPRNVGNQLHGFCIQLLRGPVGPNSVQPPGAGGQVGCRSPRHDSA